MREKEQAIFLKEKEVTSKGDQAEMGNLGQMLDTLLYRQYLERLPKSDVIPFTAELPLEDYIGYNIRVLKIERLVYEKKKEKLEELLNLYSSIYGNGAALFFLIKSDGEELELYLGVRQLSEEKSVSSSKKILESCLQGQFTGSRIRNLNNNEIKRLLESKEIYDAKGIATLTGIPSRKTQQGEDFVQGVDRFIDAMRGRSYSVIVIAEPISETQIDKTISGYALLSTLLSMLAERQIAVQQTNSTSTAQSQQIQSQQISFSEAFSQSLGLTQSTTTTQRDEGNPLAAGIVSALGAGLGFWAGGIGGAKIGLGVASMLNSALDFSPEVETTTKTKVETTSKTETTTKTQTQTETITQTTGYSDSHSESLTKRDRLLMYHLRQIDRQIQRLKEGGRYGFWNTGIYFLAPTTEEAQIAASIFQGLFRGENSDLERTRCNIWSKSAGRNFIKIKDAIQHLHHPSFNAESVISRIVAQYTNLSQFYPTTLLSSAELALIMGLPEKSLPGLSVQNSATFGRQVSFLGENSLGNFELGNIFHLGKKDPLKLYLNLKDLSSHTLITGSTGSGKSNAAFKMLKELHQRKIPFLVIESNKREYSQLQKLSTKRRKIKSFSFGTPDGSLLKINLFRFPSHIHVLEHIDRLGQLFALAFPINGMMSAILDEALHQVYEEKGWDLQISKFKGMTTSYPTIHDLLKVLPQIAKKSSYLEIFQSEYFAGLLTRLRSLTRGLREQIFSPTLTEETSEEELFENSCIVNLKNIASTETRSLVIGMLLLRLYEYRQGQTNSARLKHVTLLEEAHHLLRNVAPNPTLEVNFHRNLAIEMFSNIIAEMRSMHEGFIIVESSASSLAQNILKNTQVKITFRTFSQEDRELIGRTVNMTSEQIVELGRLETGVAAVFQHDWIEPVLCKFPLIDFPS